MIRTSPTVGHNSEAASHLRAFIERLERLEEERKTLADDIAEVYKELVSDGFDKEAAKTVLKIRRKDGGLNAWTVRSESVDLYLAALGMLPSEAAPRARAHTREIIEEFPTAKGESNAGDSEQRVGRQGSEQHREAPVSGAVGRGESADAGDQGQGAGASQPDRPDRAVSRERDRQDEDGRSGDVGGETHHEVIQAPTSRPEASVNPVAHLNTPATEKSLAKEPSNPDRSGGVHDEFAFHPATPFEPPAFLTKQDKPEANERCERPKDCKFSHHPQKVTCSTCKTAWDIARRKERAAA